MNVYIVRHCSAEGQGADADLTDEGHRQAVELKDFLLKHDIEHIVSSPYNRAVQSIEPLAHELNLEIPTDERLKERVLSSKNHSDWMEKLKATFLNKKLAYEGGESSAAATGRIQAVVGEVTEQHTGNTAIVTHGNLMSLLLNHYDDSFGFENWQQLSNPDVYAFTRNNNTVLVERIWQQK